MIYRRLLAATSLVSSLIRPPGWSLEDVLRRKTKAFENTINILENYVPKFTISPNEKSSMISLWDKSQVAVLGLL
jgi:hypothetical protein